MKIFAYEVREDEAPYFREFAEKLGLDVECFAGVLDSKTIELARGFDGVTTLGVSNITAGILDGLRDRGIKFYATRTVGLNHIDLKHAAEIGMRICNSDYPPSGVADYTVMLILMSLRNYKPALWRQQVNDYSLDGLRGKELGRMTVGIVGTGRIGREVMKDLSGFGCKMLGYDKFENDQAKKYAKYVDLDTLYRESDIISFHTPLTEETYHMVDSKSIEKMRNGVVLINCARGELMEIEALISGIESGKIGALAVDVVENEEGIFHFDRRNDIIRNREIAYLRQFKNVIMTQHMAFYTDVAVESMVECALRGLKDFAETGTCRTEIKL